MKRIAVSESNITIKKLESGFTLLELLMVVSIISIISLFTIPWYQDYQVRAEIASSLFIMKEIQKNIEEYAVYYGTFPVTNAELGLKPASQYANGSIKQIYLDTSPVDGALIIELDIPRLGSNNELILVPEQTGGYITWGCGHSTLKQEYRPSICN